MKKYVCLRFKDKLTLFIRKDRWAKKEGALMKWPGEDQGLGKEEGWGYLFRICEGYGFIKRHGLRVGCLDDLEEITDGP